MSRLQTEAKKLPHKPGVYLMKGPKGEVLYVGKASDLRSRVGSYFSKEGESRYQIRFLMAKVHVIESILTHTTKEALLLEDTLIKKHRPRYNVHLKDDKSYVSLRLSIQHEAPRLYVTRRIRKDGSLYYGPYASAGACREVVDFVQRHFRLRNCSDHDYRNRVRPCLQYQIKRCDAPCVGYIGLEEYGKITHRVRLFLEGKNDELKRLVEREMKSAAKEERFEEAARYRDLTQDIERTLEKQKVVSHQADHRDVLGYYREGASVLLYLMMIQEGKLQDSRSFFFKSHEDEDDLLPAFLTQFYGEGHRIPKEILVSHPLTEKSSLEEILGERAGHRVRINHPQRGEKLSLLKMAQENAQQAFQTRLQKEQDQKEILEELQKKLHLKNYPHRLECYDISNFQGQESMGSMVTFVEGEARPKLYRHFKIKEVAGSNDFASLYEVLSRRLRRSSAEAGSSPDKAWALPDLVVIDGGKGQLNAAAQAFKDAGVQGIDLISLAKSRLSPGSPLERSSEPRERSEERVFLLGRKDPVFLQPHSSVLFLLVRARDESHRFGIESHRKWRQRRTLYSGLEKIAGVGKVRRQKLLKHFGSLKRIKDAEPGEIAEVIGVSLEMGRRVKESL